MRAFLIVGNKAFTRPFNLNDIPGAGRMDIMCRCVSQALFVSHGIRKDVEVYLFLLGQPDPPKCVLIRGSEVKRLAPDERNIAGHINKALSFDVDENWKEVHSGVYIARKKLEDLLKDLCKEYEVYYMREDGEELSKVTFERPLFVIGDHIGVIKEVEEKILNFAKKIVKVSEISLMAEQCIVIAHYELDKRAKDLKTLKNKDIRLF
ncbi:MAG: tRNA (pseudouridine(54)-N(1))-methyltransferase TrmY [Archaeoglobaceae archaeon]|nr:tRNA (pseudouridine(54)-N(1))-methyltransferase TrmY [Archaeoglobaceae archaeon]MCX8152126.1 tRNA (pseudouridine(54)-N(1))-methyltransferase TrmY [Archaeoglobaceae archaeon]MDW8013562.1 tRNA (pseudouridine(54)-N(1))-methyltransferase TrmY [Archaeoglobaceae archaeon]